MTRFFALQRVMPVAFVVVSLLAIGNASPSQAITYTFPTPGVKTDAGYLPAGSCRAESPMPCPVTALTFSPDGKLLASVAGDETRVTRPGEVKIWDAATGTEKFDLVKHEKAATSLAFSSDGKYLATT
ncbi:MAG: hypothetical protein D6741_20725, partial [Planctomycetota bacterium]